MLLLAMTNAEWNAIYPVLVCLVVVVLIISKLRSFARLLEAKALVRSRRLTEAVAFARSLPAGYRVEVAELLIQCGEKELARDVLEETLRSLGSGREDDSAGRRIATLLLQLSRAGVSSGASPTHRRRAAPAPARAPSPGARVGPYRLERLIAEGGFGQVWKARRDGGSEAVALKVPTHPKYLETLKRQGRVQSTLANSRIVSILESDLDCKPPYIAMEYVAGEDLRTLLQRDGRLPWDRAARLFRETLLAVKAAHDAGVLHRDLKPENVLVADGDRVKVCDFETGEARENAERPLQRSQGLETTAAIAPLGGTPAYMAPEQLAGEGVDRRADIWALGMIFFEMLAGRRPQPGDKPSDFVPGIPGAFDEVFARCYTRLEKRFSSADEALAALDRAGAPAGA